MQNKAKTSPRLRGVAMIQSSILIHLQNHTYLKVNDLLKKRSHKKQRWIIHVESIIFKKVKQITFILSNCKDFQNLLKRELVR